MNATHNRTYKWRNNRKSPSGKCDRLAFAASWSIAPTTGVRTRCASALIDGRTMFDCPILSRCSCVRRAAGEAPISGPIGIGNYRDGALVADRGWKRRFQEPIPLPRGRQLVTLEDAGRYITKLPKAEHGAPEWLAAMEALILVAKHNGPTMMARIGVMRALNRGHVREFNPDRKDHHWGKRKLARDR